MRAALPQAALVADTQVTGLTVYGHFLFVVGAHSEGGRGEGEGEGEGRGELSEDI